jgi:hypothetical protein
MQPAVDSARAALGVLVMALSICPARPVCSRTTRPMVVTNHSPPGPYSTGWRPLLMRPDDVLVLVLTR